MSAPWGTLALPHDYSIRINTMATLARPTDHVREQTEQLSPREMCLAALAGIGPQSAQSSIREQSRHGQCRLLQHGQGVLEESLLGGDCIRGAAFGGRSGLSGGGCLLHRLAEVVAQKIVQRGQRRVAEWPGRVVVVIVARCCCRLLLLVQRPARPRPVLAAADTSHQRVLVRQRLLQFRLHPCPSLRVAARQCVPLCTQWANNGQSRQSM